MKKVLRSKFYNMTFSMVKASLSFTEKCIKITFPSSMDLKHPTTINFFDISLDEVIAFFVSVRRNH